MRVIPTLRLLGGMALLPWTANAAQLPKASKAQIEHWLEEHIVAWDDSDRMTVDAKDCSITIKTKTRARVINLAGVLKPIEIIRYGSDSDAMVRVRLKSRYSGDYGLEKECSTSNEWCQQNVGKWAPLARHDFRVSHVRAYSKSGIEHYNTSKADRLKDAIDHYADLCGATEYDFTF